MSVRTSLLFALFLFFGNQLFAQVYRLERVSQIDSDGMYVFEQEGRVFSNVINTGYLQTTDTYAEFHLAGDETYIWTLEQVQGGFRMKNSSRVANPSDNIYLQCESSSTGLSFCRKANATVWTFTPQADGTFLIQSPDNSNRFLGLADDNISYRAYAVSNLEKYEHAIAAYRLVPEDVEGDINADGKADISDVTLLIDIILGRSVMSDIDQSSADLTADGTVDISDVTALIDIILGIKH